ncbi:cytochrome P450 [Bailinhaonella thermotolerans]|uniref:Cytochrome P450 n=1 Tax=Bailinhaonella thermotolerans TaxID=1070861 RepID=A0A3A4A711_9ACTN|nr:cytochrome P450 [Bailinhaonella thermotolerans]RJL22807.1 cytochrome P450 [Bailinhaonella thermotolerans]
MRTPITLPVERPGPFEPPPELAALPPVVRMAYPDGHLGWLVTGHAAARVVLADPRFSARQELRHAPIRMVRLGDVRAPSRPGMFPSMDPPGHTRYRRLLTGWFTTRRIAALEPRIAEIARERLDLLAGAGPPADLVADYALPIPSLVICEILGVPYTDHAFFQEQAGLMVSLEHSVERAREAMGALYAYLGDLARHQRARPGDDLLGALARDGDLTDEELANIALILLVAGHETTASMISLGVLALLRHPAELARLRADPALAAPAVEELLRYLTILHLGAPSRAALEDVELEGELIRAGETVTLALPVVNRDPAEFPGPGRLRLDRPEAGRHLAFGHGVHLCLGHHLARTELRVAYTALFARFPSLRLAIPPGEVRVRAASITLGLHALPVTWDTPA